MSTWTLWIIHGIFQGMIVSCFRESGKILTLYFRFRSYRKICWWQKQNSENITFIESMICKWPPPEQAQKTADPTRKIKGMDARPSEIFLLDPPIPGLQIWHIVSVGCTFLRVFDCLWCGITWFNLNDNVLEEITEDNLQ